MPRRSDRPPPGLAPIRADTSINSTRTTKRRFRSTHVSTNRDGSGIRLSAGRVIMVNVARNGNALNERVVAALRQQLSGGVLSPEDEGYDAARQSWNAMIDRRPGGIARCTGRADVHAAIRFARENNLLVSIRAGGHNIAGLALCDGGLMIDLSRMKDISVDAMHATATA